MKDPQDLPYKQVPILHNKKLKLHFQRKQIHHINNGVVYCHAKQEWQWHNTLLTIAK